MTGSSDVRFWLSQAELSDTESAQQLLLVTRDAEGRIKTREMMAVRFSQLVTSH